MQTYEKSPWRSVYKARSLTRFIQELMAVNTLIMSIAEFYRGQTSKKKPRNAPCITVDIFIRSMTEMALRGLGLIPLSELNLLSYNGCSNAK